MPDRIHVYRDQAGEWRWRRRAPNGEIVAESGEGYEARQGAIDAANREASELLDAEVDAEVE